MAQDSFNAAFRAGAKLPGRALGTDFWGTAIFPVTVPVGGTVCQGLIFRADRAVIGFIINILPTLVPAFHRQGTFAGSGQHPAIGEHFFADVWSFVCGIRHNGLNLWKTFGHFVVDVVERHAVVDIAGGNHRFQHIAVLIADGMGLIGKLPLMFSLHKHTAIRVCGAFCHCFEACLLPLTKPFLMAELSLFPSVEVNTVLCALIVMGIRIACYLWICRTIPLCGIDDIRMPQVVVLATTVLASVFIKTVQKAVSDGYGSVDRHPELTVYFVLLQAALLLCLVFFEQYQRKLRKNTSYRLQVAVAKVLLEHLGAQQARDEEIWHLRHDLKNHMLAIRHLIQANRKQDAIQYIDGFLEQAGHGELHPQTGHALLDCLISEKLTPAVKSGVEISVVLDFRQGCFLEDFDLCVIMGNALDNAVESCLKIPGDQPRFIEIRGGPSANQLIIHVVNSCLNPAFHSGKLPITTKPNRECHGFGLGNVRQVLKKYDGQLVISSKEEGRFSLCILIPLS